jgi:periplasmic divalent cation tolerance protein
MIERSQLIELSTTTATQEEAQQIAAALVNERLAACVQIDGPIESVYRWQGEVETAREWRVRAKTSHSFHEKVVATIGRHHSYECPELVATQIVGGSEAYLGWLLEQLGEESS